MKLQIFKWPKENYPFLNLYFEMIEDLKLMKNLPPILEFIKAVKEKYNHKISRNHAKEVKIEVFLKENNYN